MTTAKHYYEAHVTIDPVSTSDRVHVAGLVANYRFKLANLLMDKGVPSSLDTFMTGHDTDLDELVERTRCVVIALQTVGWKVRRYKIEDCVIDSRIRDELELLR